MKLIRLFYKSLLGLSLLLQFVSPTLLWAESDSSVGKIVLLKGDVRQTLGKIQKTLKDGDSVPEGAVIKTGVGGAVKIFLQDQTTLSLGSNSTLDLAEVKSKTAPNISLVEGQIRTKVMKNLIASSIANHPIKFIVRTKTAAMGVRGTDFEVIYNSSNQVTSLITFEGAVAMIKADPNASAAANSSARLAPLLIQDKAVIVTEGRFSSSNPGLPQVTLPVKISPAQFESLKRADPSNNSSVNGNNPGSAGVSKSYVSPIPPGVDPKSFSSTSASLDRQVAAALGISTPANGAVNTNSFGANVSAERAGGASAPSSVNGFTVAPAPPPEGQYNSKTGSYAPPAGGFVDLKSGIYIAPPPGSAFDPNTGVYTPPAAMGKFDSTTGSYVPPVNFQIDPKLGLVSAPAIDPNAAGAQNTANGGRTLASANSSPGSANSGSSATANGASPSANGAPATSNGGIASNNGASATSNGGSGTANGGLASTSGSPVNGGLGQANDGSGSNNGGSATANGGLASNNGGAANAPVAGGAPSIVPGFSVLNEGQGTVSNLPGITGGVNTAANIPSVSIPGMVGGALPGMNVPGGNNSGSSYSGYGAPIAVNLPPPPPVAPVITAVNPGADPACPYCSAPPAPPTVVLPTSTKVGFSFTVQ